MTINDPQRCFAPATFGITIGDATTNTCIEHFPILFENLTRGKLAALVYSMKAKRRCEFRFAEKEGEK